MITIYGLGNALVDTEVAVSDANLAELNIDKGLMTLIDESRFDHLKEALPSVVTAKAAGGSGANTIVGAAQLGTSCYYACRVSDDENGRFYLDELSRYSVKTPYEKKQLPEGKTGLCFVMVTPDHERSLNTFLGITSTFSDQDVDLEPLTTAKLLYIEGYLVASPTAQEAAVKAKSYAEKHGVKTAITLSDPNMVTFFRDGLLRMVGSGVDLLFCNEEEALKFTQTQTIEDALTALKPLAKTVAMTLGSKGSLVWDGQVRHDSPVYPVSVKDTNGAGDAFAAGFLAAYTQGLSAKEAAHWGNIMAAHVVAQFGPRLTDGQLTNVFQILRLQPISR